MKIDGPADRQAELLPLRMDAAALLDQSLHLKNRLASERRTLGARIVRRLHVWASALQGVATRSAPSRPRKQDPGIRHCAAVLLKSGLFDAEYYLQCNPDVAAAGIDPVTHYLRVGAAELRNPGPYFSTRWYVKKYPDVVERGRNPLYHFIVSGYAEGRLPRPPEHAPRWTTGLERPSTVAPPVFGPVSAPKPSNQTSAAPRAASAAPAPRSNARLVVYTALFGNYDDLFLPTPEQALGCDFVVFTDQPNIPPPWRRQHLDYAAPTNSRQNQFYKLLPHRLFPQYEWSLYLDANVDLQVNPLEFFERYRSLGPDFLLFRHPERTSIVEELAACIERRKDDGEKMLRQVARYLDRGFRHTFPLTENNILLRRHNDPELAELSEAWWEEVRSNSGRDQLSLPYVVKQKAYRRIALFEEGRMTARNCPAFRLRAHRHQFYPRDPLDAPID